MKKKYNFNHALIKIPIRFLNIFKWHYKRLNKYKIKKGESVLVISNHQTEFDAPLISLSFNKPILTIASDTFFSGKNRRFYSDFLGYIPHRKGMSDYSFSMKVARAVKDGCSILLFPEGNRTYAEFQYYVTKEISRFIKALKVTLVLFNLKGGTGINPRWGNGIRKGRFTGKIIKVLKYEEYKNMPNDELFKLIMDSIRVFDSESNQEFQSDKRAEYLEEMLFVCPKCHGLHTLHSHNQFITCDKCGLEVEYTADLKLKSNDKDFSFNILNDWYQYQKQVIKEMDIKLDSVIFEDEGVKLVTKNPGEDSNLIDEGKIVLTDKYLKIGNTSFDLKDIVCASPFLGKNLQISVLDDSFMVLGPDRFNPLKYMFILHRLETTMKEKGTDKLFDLD